MSTTQTITQPIQPDIQYHPDKAKYEARSKYRKENEELRTTLPTGFPEKLVSPLVWDGRDIEKQDDWAYNLSDAQLDELDTALKSFKGISFIIIIIMVTTS